MPAVLNATGQGKCYEAENCEGERMAACAFEACKASAGSANACSVAFLNCFDTQPWSRDIPAVGARCAAQGGLDYGAVHTCYSGPRGAALLGAASAVFRSQFPGPVGVPAITVNAQFVGQRNPQTVPTFAQVKAAMCAAGSKAAVCAESGEGTPVQL